MKPQPSPSSSSDLFVWESQVTIASNVVGANTASDRVQVDSDRFFVLMGFLGSTNYDQVAGDFIAVIGAGPASARTLVSPPFHPNNFEVMIRYNSDTDMMGVPMPQACLCSNGYRSGPQLPFPTLYAPMTTFDFDFFNVAPTLQLTGAGAARDLQITFGLYGYFVPIERLSAFLQSYRAYQIQAQGQLAGWIANFTSQDMSKVPGV